ncbi:ABC transporter permease [Halomarina halobia]|uniref:ABC transporter permease n=1 Tax=Halomarina halobia TaxID=3033386 RepID=A0ABD6AE32_9EURY|nr:ABC transporter permease [Halomarina sp. PSR21]
MGRARFLLVRTLQTVFMLWFALTFIFFFFRLLPGSFTDIMMFRGASPETIAAFEQKWGLNDPLHIQYVRYMRNFLVGDVGMSLQFRQPVWDFVKMKIFNSFILVAPAITVTYIIGSLIGGYLGEKRGQAIEKYGLPPIVFSGAFPEFFIAIVLIIVFAGWLNLFPTSGMFGFQSAGRFADAPWWRPYLTADFAHHYILPFTAVVFRYLYLPVLIMRTSVVEVLGQDFFFYHRMTGIPGGNRMRHLLKHASLPVITLYPVSMTRAIGGLVLIEIVFNWPGIGYALVQGVLSRDFPVVQFVFFLVAAFVIIANFGVDVIYGIIDPRVSVGDD